MDKHFCCCCFCLSFLELLYFSFLLLRISLSPVFLYPFLLFKKSIDEHEWLREEGKYFFGTGAVKSSLAKAFFNLPSIPNIINNHGLSTPHRSAPTTTPSPSIPTHNKLTLLSLSLFPLFPQKNVPTKTSQQQTFPKHHPDRFEPIPIVSPSARHPDPAAPTSVPQPSPARTRPCHPRLQLQAPPRSLQPVPHRHVPQERLDGDEAVHVRAGCR